MIESTMIHYNFKGFCLLAFLMLWGPVAYLMAQEAEDSLQFQEWLREANGFLENDDLERINNLEQDLAEAFTSIGGKYPVLAAQYTQFAGNLLLNKDRYQEGLQKLEKALEQMLVAPGLEDIRTAQVLNDLGNGYFSAGQYGSALATHQQALLIRESLLPSAHPDLADSYNNIANCYYVGGYLQPALEYYNRVLQIRTQHYGPVHPDVAQVLNNLGSATLANGQYETALAYFREALQIRKTTLGPAHIKSISVVQNIGSAFFSAGRLDSAALYTQEALEQLDTHFPGRSVDRANAYHNLGNINTRQHRYAGAAKNHRQALELRKSILGEAHPKTADSYLHLGDVYFEQNEFSQALLYFNRAAGIYEIQYGTFHPLVANVLDRQGMVLRYTGRYEEALDAHQQVLTIRESREDADPAHLAGTYVNLGNCYFKMRDYQAALEAYGKSLELLERSGKSSADLSAVYRNIGNCHVQFGDYEKAMAFFQRSVPAQEGEYPVQWAVYHRDIGMVESLGGNFAKAEQAFAKALDQLAYSQNAGEPGIAPLETLQILNLRAANQAHSCGDTADPACLTQVAARYEEALSLLDQLKENLPDPESQQLLAEQHYPLFEGAIGIHHRLWEKTQELVHLEKAFTYNERSKGGLLLEAIRRDDAIKEADRDLQTGLDQLQSQIAYTERQRFDSARVARVNYGRLRYYDSLLVDLKQQRDALNARLLPEISIRKQKKVIDLEAARAQLLENKTGLVSYFVGHDDIFIFYLDKKDQAFLRLPHDFPLDSWVKELGTAIANYPFVGKEEAMRLDSLYTTRGVQLYQKIWQPLTATVDLPQGLTLVPDGPLSHLAFEALLTALPDQPRRYRSYPYLLKAYNISYAYSATIQVETLARPKILSGRGCLAVSPTFEGHSRGLEPLPYNVLETESIGKITRARILGGAKATLPAFLKLAPKYRVLHLATHGKSSADYGDYSFLAFTEIADTVDNEYLFVDDLYHLPIPAEMVVLSACETGAGENRPGEGWISLGRGFAHAGAHSIISTLWWINDAKTAEFMASFYQSLQEGLPKDEALRQTKLEYIQEATHEQASPFYWAAYVPFGDMDPIRIRRNWSIWIVGAALLLVCFFLLVFIITIHRGAATSSWFYSRVPKHPVAQNDRHSEG